MRSSMGLRIWGLAHSFGRIDMAGLLDWWGTALKRLGRVG